MMIGEPHAPADPERLGLPSEEVRLAVRDLRTEAEGGRAGLAIDTLTVHAREIVGIAGVSGNGQKDLVEVLGGQRPIETGSVEVDGAPYGAGRSEGLDLRALTECSNAGGHQDAPTRQAGSKRVVEVGNLLDAVRSRETIHCSLIAS